MPHAAITRRRVRRIGLLTLLGAIAAILVAYRPSFVPPGLHPRNVEFATAKAELLVDTVDSALIDRNQDFTGPVQLSVTYALYLQSDAVRLATGQAIGLRGQAVKASGPFTLLIGRTNLAPSGPKVPPFPTDGRYRLLVDVDGARPMITLYGQAPTTRMAAAIVNAASALLQRHVEDQQRAFPLSAPDRATLRPLGPAQAEEIDPDARPELMGFAFAFVTITGLLLLEGRDRRRRARAQGLGRDRAAGAENDVEDADDWPHTRRLLPWSLAAFLAMIFLVPFDSAQLPLVHLPLNSNMDRPILVAIVALWLSGIAFASGAMRPQVKLTAIHVAMILFFVACCLSLALNGNSLITMGDLTLSVKKIALLFSYIVLFIVVASVVRPTEVSRYVSMMIVLGVIVALATVIEFRFHFNLFYSLWRKVIPVTVPADLDKPDSIGRLTVYGPTGQPLELAAMLAMVFPFAMARLIDSDSRRRRIVYLIAVGALLAGGLATSRKTSIVAPVIGLLVLVAYRPKAMLGWTLRLSLPLFILIHLTSPGALGSVLSQLEPGHVNTVLTTKDRTARYDAVRPDVMTHVLIGRGYQSYDPHKYRILDNQYLQVVIGVGLIGLALYGAIFACMMVCAHPTIRGPNRKRAGLALGATGAVAVVVISNALFDVMSFPHVPYLLFFIGGMILALRQHTPRAPQNHRQSAELSPSWNVPPSRSIASRRREIAHPRGLAGASGTAPGRGPVSARHRD
jgi:hypothetical protein